MFRAQSNVFDDVVVKATDENLTSENWEYILVWQPPLESPGSAVSCRGSALRAAASCSLKRGRMVIHTLTWSPRTYATKSARQIVAHSKPLRL